MFMKYNKIDLNEKLFGDDFIVYDWKDDNDTVTTVSYTHLDVYKRQIHDNEELR